jgi:hypothetical protein
MTLPFPIRVELALVIGWGAAGCAPRDQLTAVVQVYEALGGGWELPPTAGEGEAR